MILFILLVVSLLLAGCGMPAWAADPPQMLDLLPGEGEIVQGTVTLTVYARCQEGASYSFYYMGDYDNDWLPLGEAAEVSREEGVAEATYLWDTSALPDGWYTIRAVRDRFGWYSGGSSLRKERLPDSVGE